MKVVVTTIIAMALNACTATIPTNYAGPDAGRVVLGFGAANDTTYSTYTLLFRNVRSSAESVGAAAKGYFVFCQTNVFCGGKFDYEKPNEVGVVLIASLPAGSYEIYNFDVFYNAGTVQKNFSSKRPFSIPFEVKPGTTAYLGNYQANGISGKNVFGMAVPAGAIFIVEDRTAVDVGIASKKDGSLFRRVESYVPDVRTLASPFFVARQ